MIAPDEQQLCERAVKLLAKSSSKLHDEFVANHPNFAMRLINEIEQRDKVRAWLKNCELSLQAEGEPRFSKIKARLLEAIESLPTSVPGSDCDVEARGIDVVSSDVFNPIDRLSGRMADIISACNSLQVLWAKFKHGGSDNSQATREDDFLRQCRILQTVIDRMFKQPVATKRTSIARSPSGRQRSFFSLTPTNSNNAMR